MSESEPDIPVETGGGRPVAAWAVRVGGILVWLAGDVLVADAAYETWRRGSPMALIVVGSVALFALLTLYVLSKGGRVGGRGWLTDPSAPYVVWLSLLIWATDSRDTIAHGPVTFGQTTDVALVATLLLLVALAVLRFSGPGGVRTWWLRLPIGALGVYAAWSVALALTVRTGAAAVLDGNCEWRALPVWLRGGHVGAFVMLPLAFFHDFAESMKRLTLVGLFRWMVVFALGIWLAIRVASV